MESSILNNTKKVLGLHRNNTAFDDDVIMHINSTFASLTQLGVGAVDGFVIEDESAVWEDLALTVSQISLVKTYVYLKTRMLFDPPVTSFAIEAVNSQIAEHEFRISMNREWDLDPNDPMVVVEEVVYE